MKYYVQQCPDTQREFLVETGRDNNILELTPRNVFVMRLVTELGQSLGDLFPSYSRWYSWPEEQPPPDPDWADEPDQRSLHVLAWDGKTIHVAYLVHYAANCPEWYLVGEDQYHPATNDIIAWMPMPEPPISGQNVLTQGD